MVVAVWKEAGFFMIFYLAALQPMSPHLAEAAAIEGASRWYFFRRVTFPLLMPTTLFVLVNAVINAFRLVDHIVVMTRGGPDNATTLLLYYIYEIGFRFWDSAYAAALTMVLLGVARRSPRWRSSCSSTARSTTNERTSLRSRRAALPAARARDRRPRGCSALLWMLPLAYAVWTAFHPASTRRASCSTAPLTLAELRQRLGRGAVRALLRQHRAAGDDDPRRAAGAGARWPPTPSRASSSPAATCCSRWCWCS